LVWYGVSKLNDATMISSKMNMMISQKKRDCITAPATTYYRVYRVDRIEANWAQKDRN
jgi:hypothetical protein